MLIPYSWLKDFLDLRKSAPQVAEDLSNYVIGVKEIQKISGEQVLNLDVTYNRGDLLSVLGFARELGALYDLKIKNEAEKFQPSSALASLNVKSKDELARYYTLTKITNLAYKTTPNLIQKRLEAGGMRIINLFADLTNYVMLEYGQPFHAFDVEKVARRDPTLQIEVRHAKNGETIKTLDGLDHRLNDKDIVIADRRGAIAIAGVMGSHDTEVDEGTKEIFLEAAIFDPASVRRTARRLGLRSEAQSRFEHHLSPENLLRSLSRIIQLYQEHGKGEVSGFTAAGIGKAEIVPVILTHEKLSTIGGFSIPLQTARGYLERLGFKVMSSEKGLLSWPPDFRGDIKIPVDLAEEVLRLHGYENLPVRPLTTTIAGLKESKTEKWRNLLDQLLTDSGFTELKNYSFVTTKVLPHLQSDNLNRLKNPVSQEEEYLRPNLLFSLLETAQKNVPYKEEGKIFELEKVYPKSGEVLHLGALIWGQKNGFLSLKNLIEGIAKKTHLNFDYIPTKNSLLHPTAAAEIKVANATLGFLGLIHPHLADAFDLKDVAVFELDFEMLIKEAQPWGSFKSISIYPEIKEDFSFTLAENKPLGKLIEQIKKSSSLLQDVRLIDRYEEKGLRSLTLRVIFQAEEKSLSTSDVKPIRSRIESAIRAAGATPRA